MSEAGNQLISKAWTFSNSWLIWLWSPRQIRISILEILQCIPLVKILIFLDLAETISFPDERYLKYARSWSYLTSCHIWPLFRVKPALLDQPFEFEYSSINQYGRSNKAVFTRSGTKFGYNNVTFDFFGWQKGRI